MAHLLDERLEPLAEQHAVGQAGQRILHGELPQTVLAGRNLGRGAARIADDEGRKQHESRERDGDERQCLRHDLGAGAVRRPCEARHRTTLVIEHVENLFPGSEHLRRHHVQVRQFQPLAELAEIFPVEQADRDQERRRSVGNLDGVVARNHSERRDDGRAPEEGLDPGRAGGAVHAGVGVDLGRLHLGICSRRAAAADVVDDGLKIAQRPPEAFRIDRLGPEQRINEAIRRIDHEDVVVVEKGLQSQSDPAVHPTRIVTQPHAPDGFARRDDVFGLAQHLHAPLADGLGEQLPLVIERHHVGAVRRREVRSR